MLVYRTDLLIDGFGREPKKFVDVSVENGRIIEIVPTGSKNWPEGIKVYEQKGMTLMPGFVDVHSHLMFGTPRSYEDVIHNDSDELMILRGPKNAYKHLRAGVTTLRDCGARNNVGFAIKQARDAKLFLSPRILACGRPLTTTGGHFWWCGQEADGEVGVVKAVRQLVKDGADFLKIMASGGGTKGTDATRPTFTTKEMKAAVDQIHEFGKKATAHCISADSVERAADAGVDQIEHFNFLLPNGVREFSQSTAEKIAKKNLTISPTIQTGYNVIEQLENKKATVGLSNAEEQQLQAAKYKLETKLDFTRRFKELGIRIVMGTDAIREFGNYAIGLKLLSRAGLSPMELVFAATRDAANAIDAEDVGQIIPGKKADMIFLDGNPLEDIDAFGRVRAVILDGDVVVDKRFDDLVSSPVFGKDMAVFLP